PPRADINVAIAAIDMWSQRADAAIISIELPWDSLLAGVPADSIVIRNLRDLAAYYRSKGHMLWVYLDPANGLNRAGEADALVNAGRSITEPAIQQLYRSFAVALDTLLWPEHFGLALETNLIRGISPQPLYDAIRQVANDAAADIRLYDALVKLSVSVQVDYAWGRLDGSSFKGIDADIIDFPFMEEIGLSSYPYLAGFSEPEDIPLDYYYALTQPYGLPAMVTEGGWTSKTLGSIASSPGKQRRYIQYQQQLLDSVEAIAVFQLTFTDIDLASLPPNPTLELFAYLGLVDVNLVPKPALTAWDAIFARPRL
ncbi:MAG: hypothetical protein L0Y74_06015, partial [candidate division Zixibacteria bacterium]|nr:hypothetical protein [candidate division Zixibacteria bacterium]